MECEPPATNNSNLWAGKRIVIRKLARYETERVVVVVGKLAASLQQDRRNYPAWLAKVFAIKVFLFLLLLSISAWQKLLGPQGLNVVVVVVAKCSCFYTSMFNLVSVGRLVLMGLESILFCGTEIGTQKPNLAY